MVVRVCGFVTLNSNDSNNVIGKMKKMKKRKRYISHSTTKKTTNWNGYCAVYRMRFNSGQNVFIDDDIFDLYLLF